MPSIVLLCHLALSISQSLSDLRCFLLGSSLSLTLAVEQLFVILDLVLELLVDLSCDVAPFHFCGPLASLLLLFLQCGELLEGFGVKALLFSGLLLAK